MRTDRERCVAVATFTYFCPNCHTYQAEEERTATGVCATCAEAERRNTRLRVEMWHRSLALQGRVWVRRNDDDAA